MEAQQLACAPVAQAAQAFGQQRRRGQRIVGLGVVGVERGAVATTTVQALWRVDIVGVGIGFRSSVPCWPGGGISVCRRQRSVTEVHPVTKRIAGRRVEELAGIFLRTLRGPAHIDPAPCPRPRGDGDQQQQRAPTAIHGSQSM
ncbi:MAG: hypothetical protein ACQEXJ_20300 [Myxococcota bacterium]